MRLVGFGWILGLAFLFAGCQPDHKVSRLADQIAFRVAGVAPLGNVETLTLKEIHLDNGGLVGRNVIVKGAVISKSPHGTYMVMSDETARLLVVLTELEFLQPDVNEHELEVVSVMGTVESGKKGLPFLQARSLHFVENPTSS